MRPASSWSEVSKGGTAFGGVRGEALKKGLARCEKRARFSARRARNTATRIPSREHSTLLRHCERPSGSEDMHPASRLVGGFQGATALFGGVRAKPERNGLARFAVSCAFFMFCVSAFDLRLYVNILSNQRNGVHYGQDSLH